MIETAQGDITDEDTEAIINPTNTNFSTKGAISRAISKKGGREIDEDYAILKTLNGFAMTGSAGQLKCKQIVHLLSPQDINECKEVARDVLNFSSQVGLESLSVPLIGAGGSQLPQKQVAVAITHAAVTLASQGALGSLKRIRLVGFNANEKAAFDEALKRSIQSSNTNLKSTHSAFGNTVTVAKPTDSVAPQSPAKPQPVVALSAVPLTSLSVNINGVTFAVASGSLIDEQTDAIVNPLNDMVKLRGRFAKDIASKGGNKVEKELTATGSKPAGVSVVTRGGSLACRHIIHILAPRSINECRQAVSAVIKSAASNGTRSIAIPLLSETASGLQMEQEAACIVDTFVDAALQHHIGGLTDVRMVGLTVPEKDAFENALTNSMQATGNMSPTPPPHPTASKPGASHSPLQSASPWAHAQSESTVNGVSIEAVQGDITDESTDAIVNPSHKNLMHTEKLSQSIYAKGGETVVKECKAIGSLNDVALTSAGALRCHHIVHVLSPRDRTECQKSLRAVLNMCVEQKFDSIAIPPIRTSGGVFLWEAAVCITDELVDWARRGALGTLKHIRLVGIDDSEKTTFEEALKQSLQLQDGTTPNPRDPDPQMASAAPMATATPTGPQNQTSSPSPSPPVQVVTPTQTLQALLRENVSGITFEVALGILADEQTDAIVNPTNEKLELTGSISRHILPKGGPAIAEELRALGRFPAFGAVVTSGGALPCHYVVHFESPRNLNQCRQAVMETLQASINKKFNSIALPLLCSPASELPLDSVASCIVQTLVDAASRNSLDALKLIRLVGSTMAETNAFESALKQELQSIRSTNASSKNPTAIAKKYEHNATLYEITIDGVCIQVLRGDICDEVTHAIVNPTDSKLTLTGRVSKAIVARGGESLVKELQKIGVLKDVKITMSGTLKCGFILHALSPVNLIGLQSIIKAVLALAASKGLGSLSIPPLGTSGKMSLELEADCICNAVIYAAQQQALNQLKLVRLVGYTEEETDALEKALRNISAHRSGGGSESSREITVVFPSTWVPKPSNAQWHQVPIKQTDKDYEEAVNLFTLSTGVKLLCIYRIQNEDLYKQYAKEKAEMKQRHAGAQWNTENGFECQLYRGADESTVNKICASGFDLRYSRKEETDFGCGCYFTREMVYLTQGKFAPQTPANGQRRYTILLYFKVFVFSLLYSTIADYRSAHY